MARFRVAAEGRPSRSGKALAVWRLLAGTAVAAQCALLLYVFAMGLGWTGLWWYLTVLQAAAGVALAAVALTKRPAAALLVPPVSLGLLLLFVQLDRVHTAHVCSPAVLAAADELGPIPGFTQRPEFLPELGRGCVARFNSPRPPAEVIQRYRSAGVRNGWTLAEPQRDGHAVMSRGTLVLHVRVNTWSDRGMYVMSIRAT